MELVFPSCCAICGKRVSTFLCNACAVFHPPQSSLCLPSIRSIRGLAPYRSPIGETLKLAKINSNLSMFHKIGHWMGVRAIDEGALKEIDSVVPVPSPWSRRLRRGFNPSAVLASEVAAALDRPVIRSLRVKPGPRQARLNRQERTRNMSRRLVVCEKPPNRVLLIDDVATTGSTAEACARKLRKAGAKEITLYIPCVTQMDKNLLQ